MEPAIGLAEGETRWALLMSKSATADFDWRWGNML